MCVPLQLCLGHNQPNRWCHRRAAKAFPPAESNRRRREGEGGGPPGKRHTWLSQAMLCCPRIPFSTAPNGCAGDFWAAGTECGQRAAQRAAAVLAVVLVVFVCLQVTYVGVMWYGKQNCILLLHVVEYGGACEASGALGASCRPGPKPRLTADLGCQHPLTPPSTIPLPY